MDELVLEKFSREFGSEAHFLVRAPGRVNLIGEHIDYNGYGVLPMAVEQSVFCAVGIDEYTRTLSMRNLDEKYPPAEVDLENFSIKDPTDPTAPSWFKYFLCGYKGMSDCLAEQGDIKRRNIGMKVIVGGNIPPSSGLSSSSALVCAGGLCTLKAETGSDFGLISRKTMAEICAKCERYIGTEGGGMDQAICMLARRGQAARIDFNPLTAKSVKLPEGAAFVVANCCVESNKAASHLFNERVVETRLAAKLLAYKLKLDDWNAVRNLGHLQELLEPRKTLQQMLHLVEQLLPQRPVKVDQLAELFDSKLDPGFVESQVLAKINNNSDTALQLKNRALHVYSEAKRVDDFVDICFDDEQETLKALGQLMDSSHESCKVLYECSCSELDSLQSQAKKLGAFGSRLTGAGWGGCTVSLVARSSVCEFVEALRNSFYANFTQEAFMANVFVTEPSSGAEIKVFHDLQQV